MLEVADALGSAWVEMWGRLWRIDTLFETGQLRLIQRELTDLGSCLDRLSRGLTNKQIGETLYVSERTAENHVQHILVKLGFSNRSQIAAWSGEGRAVDTPSAGE
jgi:DNA-binding CsgD family transcriptional regulator